MISWLLVYFLSLMNIISKDTKSVKEFIFIMLRLYMESVLIF